MAPETRVLRAHYLGEWPGPKVLLHGVKIDRIFTLFFFTVIPRSYPSGTCRVSCLFILKIEKKIKKFPGIWTLILVW